jgi:hypothetical protein
MYISLHTPVRVRLCIARCHNFDLCVFSTLLLYWCISRSIGFANVSFSVILSSRSHEESAGSSPASSHVRLCVPGLSRHGDELGFHAL